MDLFATPGNPVPPDAIVSAARTQDGLTLRVGRWVPRGPARGTILLAPGRSQVIEHYYEVVGELLARRFCVVALDWRGQGQSTREIAEIDRCHLSQFGAFGQDLAAVEAQILRPFCPRPWFALGHSMGAAALLDQAHAGRSPFARIVLAAPMIDLSLPLRRWTMHLVALVARFGWARARLPRVNEIAAFNRSFAGNPLTSDPRRYERASLAIRALPHLTMGAPTIGWLHAAFVAMARFRQARFAVETLTPILIVAAGADRIVATRASEQLGARLKAGSCLTLAGALHEIMMEHDTIRAQFWSAFDAFIPGDAGDVARYAPSPPAADAP